MNVRSFLKLLALLGLRWSRTELPLSQILTRFAGTR